MANDSSDTQGLLKLLAAYYRDIIVAFTDKGGRHLHDLTALRSGVIRADLAPFITSWIELLDNESVSITLPKVSPEEVSKVISRATREEEAETSGGNNTANQISGLEEKLTDSEKEQAAEALLAMYRKQEQDPYNRETLIGFPILCGTYGSVRYCAPMFYYPVRLEYEPLRDTIRFLKEIQTPAFNTPLLADLIGEEGVIDVVRKHILPKLYGEEFKSQTIADVVGILARIVPALKGLQTDPRSSAPLNEAMSAFPSSTPTVFHACVVVNARKGHTFLLDDLTELAKLESYPEGTAAEALLVEAGEDISEIGDPDSPEYSNPLLFPLESNPAQRRVARKAELGQLTAVEGPPGTGKSQTIANLVCHLVAHGQTVLVTSHQNKALEVVTEKIPKLEDDADRDYLAMTMLKGEAESARQLAGKLKHFDATVAAGSLEQLKTALTEALNRIQENLGEMRRLRARFSELKNLERQAASQERWHYHYYEIREYDCIHTADKVPEGDEPAVAASLGRWAELMERLRMEWEDLHNVLLTTSGESATIVKRRSALLKELLVLCDEAEALAKDPMAYHILQLSSIYEAAKLQQDLATLLDWLRANRVRLLSLVAQLAVPTKPGWGIRDALALLRRLGNVAPELVQQAVMTEERARDLAVIPTIALDDRPTNAKIQEVECALSRLERGAKSWFLWHIPWGCPGDCRRLEEAGFAKVDYTSRFEKLAAIRLWVNHWQARYQLVAFLRHAQGLGLPGDPSVQPSSPLVIILQESSYIRCCLELLQLIADMPKLRVLPDEGAILERLLEQLDSSKSFEFTLTMLSRSLEHLDRVLRLRALQQESVLRELWAGYLKGCERLVSCLTIDTSVHQALEKTKRLLIYAEDFITLLELEEGQLAALPRTLDAVRASILIGDSPVWLRRPDLAVEAHRLGSLIRRDLEMNPDDIGKVARRLRQLGEMTRSVIVQALRRQRRLALWQAAHENRSRGEIDRLRRLLSKKRKTPSLMELRDKVNYGALLKVFPCWVMGIEDVARIFPLNAGLFDYVIVDEASQCSQATALHLAYRARHMIVVGDEKQLQNPWVRFMREDDMHLLIQKHCLHEHPNADVLEARVSLLGLANRCSNAHEFLNEHFRSEPAIISWSNRHFYQNRLKILTPIWPRRFEPCMEVRVIAGADDDPDETKTNLIEAQTAVRELRRLLENPEYEGLTFGIISPFRQQADLLQDLIYRQLADHPEWIRDRRLVASTADGFQGDERDVIIYSMRYGPSSKPGSIHAIEMEEERLNVAFTRARRKVICMVSTPPEMFPSPLRRSGSTADEGSPSIRSFLEHALREQRSPQGRLGAETTDSYDSRFEEDVCQGLRNRGLKVYTQVPCAGYSIDLVVMDDDGRRIAVECDGDFHYEEGDLRPDDHHRQDIIERAGWTVHRVSFRRFYANPGVAFHSITEALLEQPTESEVLVRDLERKPLSTMERPITEEISKDVKTGSTEASEIEAASRVLDRGESAGNGLRGGPLTAPGMDGSIRGKSTDVGSPRLEGLMARSENWFALSHWGKETGLLTSFDKGFAFNIGRYLHRGWGLSLKQASHAKRIWREAAEKGFKPPQTNF
jgi:very-short-patch-repair endonuclease